jgi:hypothetical protein
MRIVERCAFELKINAKEEGKEYIIKRNENTLKQHIFEFTTTKDK